MRAPPPAGFLVATMVAGFFVVTMVAGFLVVTEIAVLGDGEMVNFIWQVKPSFDPKILVKRLTLPWLPLKLKLMSVVDMLVTLREKYV